MAEGSEFLGDFPPPQIGVPLPKFTAPPPNIFESLGKYLTDPLERERYRQALGDVPVLDPILKFGSDVAEQVFPPFFSQRQQAGLEDPTIPPILPGVGLAVGAGKNIGKAKGVWEPVERFGNWVLRNADTGEIDKGLVFTGKNAAEKAAEVAARRAAGVAKVTPKTEEMIARAAFGDEFVKPTAARVAPRVGREVAQTPGFLQTAEQRIGGGVARSTATDLTALPNETLLELRNKANVIDRASVDAEIARRATELLSPPGLNVTATLQQIPRPLATAVRRRLRNEPNLDSAQLLDPSTGFGDVIDNAIRTVRAPITPENRLRVAGALLSEQRAANVRNAGVNAARRQAQIAALERAIPPSAPGAPVRTVGDVVSGVASRRRPPRPPQKPPNLAQEIYELPRALRATLDVSALLRQGLTAVVPNLLSRSAERRGIAARAFKNAVRGYGEKFATQEWQKIKSDPLYDSWKKAGGFASDLTATGPTGVKEEFFTSQLAEKIPVLGQGVKAAERSYALTLNALRFQTWKEGVLAREAIGRPMSEGEQKAFAQFMNLATGRGSLGKFEGAASLLNAVFWAPKFVLSRLQIGAAPIQALRAGYPELAKREAKDLAKTFVAGLGMLQIANAAGMKVGLDPTSTDFGKIVIGNTSIDIWGGFQQPAVLLARLVLNESTSSTGVSRSLSSREFGSQDAGALVGRFVESKFGPTLSTAKSMVTGKDFVGQPFGPRGGESLPETILSVLGNTVVPLSWEEVVQAIRDDIESGTSSDLGIPAGVVGAVAGSLGLTGVGVSTYDRGDIGVATERGRLGDVIPKSPTFSDLPVSRQLEYQEIVRTAVDDRLKSVIQSSAYLAASDAEKKRLLDTNKRAVENETKRDFALNVVMSGSPDEILPAINGALAASSGNYQKGMALQEVRKLGKLSPEIVAKLDGAKDENGLTVDEYLRGSQEVQKWLAAPEFVIGSKREWDAAALAASRLKKLIADAKRRGIDPASDKGIVDFYAYSAGGNPQTRTPGWLANLYDRSGVKRETAVSPQRREIQKSNLWSRFSQSANDAERPAP